MISYFERTDKCINIHIKTKSTYLKHILTSLLMQSCMHSSVDMQMRLNSFLNESFEFDYFI